MSKKRRSIDDVTPEEWDSLSMHEQGFLQDPINPAHYKDGDIECIKYIEDRLGKNINAYHEGAAIKYLHRYRLKQKPAEDLRKAIWHIEKLIKSYP